MDRAADIGAAFDKLDQLLAVAQEAGPSIALLMELGRQQGITEMTMFRRLEINATIIRWAQKLGPDAAADRDELDGADVGALLLKWARAAK
jgi:hypothetical protein